MKPTPQGWVILTRKLVAGFNPQNDNKAEAEIEIPESGQWVPGEFMWHIPVYWTLDAQNGTRDLNPETSAPWPSTLMTYWDQQFALDSTGKLTVTKFGVTVSRTLNDNYETSETPNPNQ